MRPISPTAWKFIASRFQVRWAAIRSYRQSTRQANKEVRKYLLEISRIPHEEALYKQNAFLIGLIGAFIAIANTLYYIAFSRGYSTWNTMLYVISALGVFRFAYSYFVDYVKKSEAIISAESAVKQYRAAKITALDVKLPKKWMSSGYEIAKLEHGVGIWSKCVSDLLLSDTIIGGNIKIVEGEFRGDHKYRIFGLKNAIERLRLHKPFENEEKIRLRTDIVISNSKMPDTIHLEKSDYVANLGTNDLAFTRIFCDIPSAESEIIYNGVSNFLGDEHDWLGYEQSHCSNQLGTSVLAFTNDGCLFLVDQSYGNEHSAGLLAPSGSGSLRWGDLSSSNKYNNNFWGWSAAASKREMLEELGLDAESSHTSAIIYLSERNGSGKRVGTNW